MRASMKKARSTVTVDSDKPPRASRRSSFSDITNGMVKEIENQNSCRSLPFTLLFWVVFIATQIGHRQVRLQNSMRQALTGTLTSTISTAPSVANATAATSRRLLSAGGRSRADLASTGSSSQALSSVQNLAGVTKWISHTLVPQLWADGPMGRGVLFEFNRALGGVRIQQTRAGRSDCPGIPELREVYNLTCYRGDRVHPSAAELALMPGLVVDEDGVQTYWLDLASDESAVQAQIQQLWENDWFQPGTQEIWVQCILLNAQVNLLAYAEVEFELDRAGRIISLTKVFTLPTEVYGNDWLIWSGDMLILAMLLWLALAEGASIYVACRRRSCRSYFTRSRVLNWAVLLCGTGFSIFFGYLARELEVLATEIASLPPPPMQAAPLGTALGALGWDGRHRALDSVYDEVARLSGLLRGCELATFWYSLLLLLKFFTCFEGSPRLAVITATLRECCTDLFHFMVVFVVVFITFAIGAYFLFGHQLKEWSNIMVACNSAYRALMGDFDFTSMHKIAPVSSMVWFWLFMSLIFLVMLSMLLAIVLEAYTDVKERTSDKSTLWQQLRRLPTLQALSNVRTSKGGTDKADDEKEELIELFSGRPTLQDASLPGAVCDLENAGADNPNKADKSVWTPTQSLRDTATPDSDPVRPKSPLPEDARTRSVAAPRPPLRPKPKDLPLAPEALSAGGRPGSAQSMPPVSELQSVQWRAAALGQGQGTPRWFAQARQ